MGLLVAAKQPLFIGTTATPQVICYVSKKVWSGVGPLPDRRGHLALQIGCPGAVQALLQQIVH